MFGGKNKKKKINFEPIGEYSPKRKNDSFLSFSNFRKGGLNIIIAVLICIIGLGYLIEISSVATKGYQIRDLEQRLAELSEQNKKDQLKVVELQSIQKVQNKVADLNMVRVSKIDYLAVGDTVVAVK